MCPIGEIKRKALWRFICCCLRVVDGCSEEKVAVEEVRSRYNSKMIRPIRLCKL